MRAIIVAMLTAVVIVEVVLRAVLVVVATAATLGMYLVLKHGDLPAIMTPSLLPTLAEYVRASAMPQTEA